MPRPAWTCAVAIAVICFSTFFIFRNLKLRCMGCLFQFTALRGCTGTGSQRQYGLIPVVEAMPVLKKLWSSKGSVSFQSVSTLACCKFHDILLQHGGTTWNGRAPRRLPSWNGRASWYGAWRTPTRYVPTHVIRGKENILLQL